MHKVSVVFGTRPEAIKLAPVILELQRDRRFQCHVCVTGQHRQMLDQVLEAFDIRPDVDLHLMRPNQTLAGLTARAVEAIDGYLRDERPDIVLVQGDTTTVLAASLAAFYNHIPVGHVEAGLRTGNLQAPFPEEANRVIASRLATLHFAPTERNRQCLLREGVPDSQIFVTGNTVIDALLIAVEKVKASPPPVPGLDEALLQGDAPLILITGHRRESFGRGFEQICTAIATLARELPHAHLVYPVHLNPNVGEPVHRLLCRPELPNVMPIEPVPYLPFVRLMMRSTLILTDSGGIQEEAPSLGKPVLVMRETTERPEGVEAGVVQVVGTDVNAIVPATIRVLSQTGPLGCANPYGDGKAAERIAQALAKLLGPARPDIAARFSVFTPPV